MARPERAPQEMAVTMQRMSTYLLLGAAVLLVAGVVLLVRDDRSLLGVALIALGVVDVLLARAVRRQARRTAAAPPPSTSQETR